MYSASHVTFLFLRRRTAGGDNMGTVLDIKIKRANKVYREGVSVSTGPCTLLQ